MATKRKSVRYSRDEALVRYFQYQDDDTLLNSDEEESLDEQLMGCDSDSGEDSTHDDDQTLQTPMMINSNKPKALNSGQGMFKYVNLFLIFLLFLLFPKSSIICEI